MTTETLPPAAATPAATAGGRRSAAGLLLAPAVAAMSALIVLPIVAVLALSFFHFDPLSQRLQWVGVDNWRAVISGGPLRGALLRTIGYAAVVVPAQVVIGLLLAVLIDSVGRHGAFWRVVLFLPSACTLAAMAVVWRWLFYPNDGVFDLTVGRTVGAYDWLNSTGLSLAAVAVVGCWFGIGSSMIVFLAGLTTVSSTTLDAARMDKASALQRFWHVTLPALRPAGTFATVIAIGDALRVFDQVRVMTQGGPLDSSTTLSYLQYTIGVENLDIGSGAVVSVLLLVLTLVAIATQLRLGRDHASAVAR
ncbi:carbohydrate ABC transporter permease [Dactylosporangium sp. CA-233914]|uniref:carbohydrate ABC transporter permease n=1 Tax=Dactylosporangium sp. CA-233914 TaxID=3239934 RepID=UPI003D8C798E